MLPPSGSGSPYSRTKASSLAAIRPGTARITSVPSGRNVCTLTWLGTGLIPALRNPERLRGHRLELLYGLASVLFVVFSAALMVVLYRLIVQDWLSSILSDAVAAGLAWALAAAVVVLAVAGMLGELRGARRPAPSR
jgi:hypothetical protein